MNQLMKPYPIPFSIYEYKEDCNCAKFGLKRADSKIFGKKCVHTVFQIIFMQVGHEGTKVTSS